MSMVYEMIDNETILIATNKDEFLLHQIKIIPTPSININYKEFSSE